MVVAPSHRAGRAARRKWTGTPLGRAGHIPPLDETDPAGYTDGGMGQSSTDFKECGLWNKLTGMRISGEDDALPFVARLGRENGWSASRAERVYQEYLRFLYLASVAGHPVTPSEDVDQAWHLHLCYTRSYWANLCGTILGRPLHHEPTRGGPSERTRYRDQYEGTLQAYRKHFQSEPPQDIWPGAAERFHPRNDFVRVNRKDSVVVSGKMLRSMGAFSLGSLLLTGCISLWEGTPGGAFVKIILIALGVMLLIKLICWLYKHGGKGGGCGSSCGGGGGFGGCGGDSGCGGGCGGGD